MAFLDGNTNLEQVLGGQADTAAAGITDAATQKRRRLIGKMGSTGRLRSGVGNYDLTNADTAEGSDLGGIYGNLTTALGQVPAENYANERQFGRQMSLAELIAELNKPSALQEALGAFSAAGNLAGTVASFGGKK